MQDYVAVLTELHYYCPPLLLHHVLDEGDHAADTHQSIQASPHLMLVRTAESCSHEA